MAWVKGGARATRTLNLPRPPRSPRSPPCSPGDGR
jgi:hypothetical protein